MGDCDVTFCDNDAVFHVTSKAVLPEDCAKELLQHESIGNEIYQEFLQARLQGKKSIWSKITKRRYKTFKTQLMMKKKSQCSSNPVKRRKTLAILVPYHFMKKI